MFSFSEWDYLTGNTTLSQYISKMSIDLIIAVAKTLSAYANHQRQLHEITRNNCGRSNLMLHHWQGRFSGYSVTEDGAEIDFYKMKIVSMRISPLSDQSVSLLVCNSVKSSTFQLQLCYLCSDSLRRDLVCPNSREFRYTGQLSSCYSLLARQFFCPGI